MSTTVVNPPEHFQLQSPLVRLPPEIKHIIYGLSFVEEAPILDPIIDAKSPQPHSHAVPRLGMSLLQTCRQVYHEADRRPIFSQNTFRFTSVDLARNFLSLLNKDYRECIQDIELDIRRVHSDRPDFTRDLIRYLAWDNGVSCPTSETLQADAPGLKCLRLNFESWPKVPMFRTELWKLLRSMLSRLNGLERIVATGASKGSGMARKAPWVPNHFVGGENVGSEDIVPKMWSAIKGSDDSKIIRWNRASGKLHLEVVSIDYLVKHVDAGWSGPRAKGKDVDGWPENGSCTMTQYENCPVEELDLEPKRLNPNVAE